MPRHVLVQRLSCTSETLRCDPERHRCRLRTNDRGYIVQMLVPVRRRDDTISPLLGRLEQPLDLFDSTTPGCIGRVRVFDRQPVDTSWRPRRSPGVHPVLSHSTLQDRFVRQHDPVRRRVATTSPPLHGLEEVLYLTSSSRRGCLEPEHIPVQRRPDTSSYLRSGLQVGPCQRSSNHRDWLVPPHVPVRRPGDTNPPASL